jgi:hypothetical protein
MFISKIISMRSGTVSMIWLSLRCMNNGWFLMVLEEIHRVMRRHVLFSCNMCAKIAIVITIVGRGMKLMFKQDPSLFLPRQCK